MEYYVSKLCKVLNVMKDDEPSIILPEAERLDFKVLETSEQKKSLYHPIRQLILRTLNHGLNDFETEVSKSQKTLEDGTIVTEEVTRKRPIMKYWMNVQEILENIKEAQPKLKISVFNCYYHLRKLQEQDLVEQYPPPLEGGKEDSKRVRGMYFRTTAKFFVPTTFEISAGLTERDVLPSYVMERAVALAQHVRETGKADAFEYSIISGKAKYWLSVAMSLHDDGESIVALVRDITPQKEAEEALRVSQEQLELALKGADLAPWDWHHKKGEMIFSESYAKLLGYQIHEMVRLKGKWENMVHPDDLKMVLDLWDEHLSGKTPMYSSEYRLRTKHGQYVWVLDRGRVVERDEEGTPIRSAGTLQDVTADKIMMEALDRSEERYRRLVTESLQGIAILVDFKIVFANPAYASTVGRTIPQLLAMSSDQLWQVVHPDDRAELRRRNQLLDSGASTLPKHRFRYLRPDGTIRWVESYANAIEHDGSPALQTLEVDITEQQEAEAALRESEKRFRDVFQASPIGVLLFDSEGRISDFNQAAGEILGVRTKSDFEKYILQKDPHVPEWVWNDIREGEVIGFETSYDPLKAGMKSTNASPKHVHISGSAVQVLEDGTVTTYLVHIRDISEQKAAEQALAESEAKYRALVESSSQPFVILQGTPPEIVYANPAATKVAGYSFDELTAMGSSWIKRIMDPRSITGSIETLQYILQEKLGANPEGYEDRYVHKNGSLLWLCAHPSRMIFNGAPALQVLFIDRTEQRALQKALAGSKEDYLSYLEESNDSILLLDNGRVSFCNTSAVKLFGGGKNKFQGAEFWSLSPKYQPDKSTSKSKALQYLQDVMLGRTAIARWVYRRIDGSKFEAETSFRKVELGQSAFVQIILRLIRR
ncbi:MAG: PAS domain S-box protein [Candidatus Thorarchaeota archaeon]|nr:PAS domain S-box protein [Candidatus Thorarchaeota archaeon]